MKNSKTRDLVYMALYAAMFVVLDLVTIWRMPQGGSINLSSIALLLASYHLGWKKGAICGLVANGLLYVTGSMNFYGSIISLFFDYLFAYTAYGFASLFPNVKYFYSGIVITSRIRLACSTFSGCVAWGTPLWASLGYNAEYIIPVMVIDMVVVPLIFEKLKPIVNK